jgi:hypothetical protein
MQVVQFPQPAASCRKLAARAVLAVATAVSLNVVAQAALAASPYAASAELAARWLESRPNVTDGSWGTSDPTKYLLTSEAVLALGALNARSPVYYAGLSWLENHEPANVDYQARRILALIANGSFANADIQFINEAQNNAATGTKGWGLTKNYQSAALDTALALQAYNAGAGGISSDVRIPVSYLRSAQLAGGGWSAGVDTSTSDATTTAQVLQALAPFKADAANASAITAGLNTLNASVTTASPTAQKALAVLANLRANSNPAQATTLASNLLATQAADGSWGQDTYATALAARALAAAMGVDLTALREVVAMPDANLRRAVNGSLGRNALDQINLGELRKLTTLDISNRGITNLSGLQGATNLTFLDARNNGITDFAPVAGLTAATVVKDGNPTAVASANIPTLPEWGLILLGLVLMGVMSRQLATKDNGRWS